MITEEPVSRNHGPPESRPTKPWVQRPRLGWLSGLSLLALAVMQLAGLPTDDPPLAERASHLWLASVWAGWSAAVWLTSGPPPSLGRWAVLAALLAWHSGLMVLARQQPLARYVIMFAGFGVLQATAAVLLRLPRWSWGNWGSTAARAKESPPSPPPRQGQFGILSLLVLMSSVALVAWAARHYGDAGGEHFTHGAVVILLMLAGVAAQAIAATTAQSARWRVALTMLTLPTAAGAAAVMAWLEIAAQAGGAFTEFWPIYFTVTMAFALILYLLGLCGRLDGGAG